MLTKELVLTSASNKKDENSPLETNYTLTIGSLNDYYGWSSYEGAEFGSIDPIPPESYTGFFVDDSTEITSLCTNIGNMEPFVGYFGVSEFDNSYYYYSNNDDLGLDLYQPLNLFKWHVDETLHVWISNEKPKGGKEVTLFTKGEGTYTLECDTVNVPCQYLRIRYNGDPSYKAWFNFSMEYEPEQNGYHIVFEKHGRLVFDRLTGFFGFDNVSGSSELNLETLANWMTLPFLVYFFNEKIILYSATDYIKMVFPINLFNMMFDQSTDIDFLFGDVKFDFIFDPSSSGINQDLDLTAFHGKLRDSITLPLP